MRAKINYYLRFIFGFSTQEIRGFYVLFGFILFFFLFHYYLRFEQGAEEDFQFEPEVWDAALVKLPEESKGKHFYKTYPDAFKNKSTFFKKRTYSNDSRVDRTWRNNSLLKNSHADYKRANNLFLKDSRANPPRTNNSLTLRVPKFVKENHWNLDINTADSVAWVGLKGIGPGFAKRIMAYRDRLGGFNSVMQLKEVYGLDSLWVDENKSHLNLGQGILRRLMVNRSTWTEFRHPYLPYAQAKIVLAYRKQHPLILNYETLMTILLLDPLVWAKLKPYLSFEP